MADKRQTDGGTAQDRAGPPDGAVASATDFAHKRDKSGEHLPVWERIPGKTDDCEMCGGDGSRTRLPDKLDSLLDDVGDQGKAIRTELESLVGDEYTCPACDGMGELPVYVLIKPITQGDANEYLPDSGDPRELSDDEIVTLITEFVEEPDFSDVDSVDDFKAFGLDPLMLTIMNASGFELAQGLIMETDELVDAIEGNTNPTS